ncbi:MAG: phosphatase PAP2 family protein [Chitinophagales bacterium]|nr:phosphatase PAP2 family protein [Chitinophagales bacterium]
MYKIFFGWIVCFELLGFHLSFAQQVSVPVIIRNTKVSIPNLYRMHLASDGGVIAGSFALIIVGQVLNGNKAKLIVSDLNNQSVIDHIPSFDKSAIHQHDKSFLVASDVLLYTSMSLPLISFIDKRVSGHAPTILAMYFETLSIGAGLYSITSGAINRRRPLTFNDSVPNSVRLGNRQQNSFFSGHTTIAATACFFGARIFTDFRPYSKLTPYVWTAAAVVPAFVAFSRYKAGEHFPSDVVAGYVVGATVGYLVPALHKVSDERLVLSPILGKESGISMVYNF